MPYIPSENREEVLEFWPVTAGELNFFITYLINSYLPSNPRYSDFNEVIGVLECAKQELYRRRVAPYEDQKKDENGDVFT